MEIEKLIFKNSKNTIIKEGNGIAKGILYCGQKYTNNGGNSGRRFVRIYH